MALQGTIDAFPLVDVLQLLSASHKTGRLVIEGDRGTCSLWVADGALTAAETAPTTPADPVELVFEVLRFGHGSFLFEAGVDPAIGPDGRAFDAADIPQLLDGARSLLEEWATITEVVPTAAHRIRPVEELPDGTVTLDTAEWAAVLVAANGGHVAGLASALGLGEFDAARRVAGLVARGLVVVEEPAAADLLPVPLEAVAGDGVALAGPTPEDTSPDGPGVDAVPVDPLLADDRDDEPFPERFPIDDLLGEADDAEAWGATEAGAGLGDRLSAGDAFTDESPTEDRAPADEPTFVNPAFVDLGFGGFDPEPSAVESSPDPAFSDPAAFSDPDAFSDPAFSEPAAFSDDGFSDPAFSDAAFSDPAFSDPAAFSDPGPADPAFTEPAAPTTYTDDAFAAVPGAFAPAEPAAPDGTDEVLRQMSKLSPKAAEAIAAALGTAAESDTEPPAEGGSPFLQSF